MKHNKDKKLKAGTGAAIAPNPLLPAVLRRGTTKCPKCKSVLHFKLWNGMIRVIEDGFLSAVCPSDGIYYKVRPSE